MVGISRRPERHQSDLNPIGDRVTSDILSLLVSCQYPHHLGEHDMLGSWKGLGEGICHHCFCWNITDSDAIELYEFVSKMILDCDMLRSAWGGRPDFGQDQEAPWLSLKMTIDDCKSIPKSLSKPVSQELLLLPKIRSSTPDRSILQIILLTNSYNSIASPSAIFQQKPWWRMPSPRPFRDPNISCSPRN